MTALGEELQIREIPLEERGPLDELLEESFDGWYLRHARKMLGEIEVVKAAIVSGKPVGLEMLTTFREEVGYVYYVAVSPKYRRRGIAGRLLDAALEHFARLGMKEVYASVERDNFESAGLFRVKGFAPTHYGEVACKYGRFRVLDLYRRMVVVPGETLLCRGMEQ